MSATHAAVVLAAGGSRRLGQAKQLLRRDGETLVHRAVRLASDTEPVQLLVVVGAASGQVVHDIRDLRCETIENRDWQGGLAGSLRAAGRHLADTARSVLVLTCDQPALEVNHLMALLKGATASRSGCAATLHGDAFGVPAVVPRAWFDDLQSRGDHGFGARLRESPKGTVFGLHAPELALDIDTPNDLAGARKRGWLDE